MSSKGLNLSATYLRVARMNVKRHWLLLLGSCLLTGCAAETKTQVDDFWRFIDPMGHRRSHTEHYYPNERTTGVRMPKSE
jgi:hypothetical protein